MEVDADMDNLKKEWRVPTLTKVKLEFDKEMASHSCRHSGNSAQPGNCGTDHSPPGCWSSGKPGNPPTS